MKIKQYFFFLPVLIILLISVIDYQKEEHLYNIQQQSIKKIDKPFIKQPVYGILNQNYNQKQRPIYTYNGVGLLILPNKIKLNIKKDSSKKTLDSLAVGLLDISDSLDKENGVIIIAGHNMKKVFNYLHKIKKQEKIIIYTNKSIQTFKVVNKKTIDETDFTNFKKQNKKVLYLITCTKNERKRLLVTALLENQQQLS